MKTRPKGKQPVNIMRLEYYSEWTNQRNTIRRKGYIFGYGRVHITIIEDAHIKDQHFRTCVINPIWTLTFNEALDYLTDNIVLDHMHKVCETNYVGGMYKKNQKDRGRECLILI